MLRPSRIRLSYMSALESFLRSMKKPHTEFPGGGAPIQGYGQIQSQEQPQQPQQPRPRRERRGGGGGGGGRGRGFDASELGRGFGGAGSVDANAGSTNPFAPPDPAALAKAADRDREEVSWNPEVERRDRRVFSGEFLHDKENRKCTICDRQVGADTTEWRLHTSLGRHALSSAVYTVLLDNYRLRSLSDICEEWSVSALHYSNFYLIPELVSTNLNSCAERLRDTLLFLKSQGVLKTSLGMAQGRSFEFDRLEWIGDLAIYPLITDVVSAIFDLDSSSSAVQMLNTLETNEHMEAAYDSLSLGEIVESGAPMYSA